jgi:RimJ/RimL family protein N-acetyltransferase
VKHDLHVRGYAFGLRPITLEDAEFIVQLRSDPERTRFLHPIPLSVEAQRAYLERYFERENDYYFVVERHRDNFRVGLIGIYNVNCEERTAEWGRWILRPGSLASVESVLRVYETAFDYLHFDEVYCRTVTENQRAVSFHDRYGLKRRAVLHGFFTLGHMTYDAVEHCLSRQDWPQVRQRMDSSARSAAERIQVS